MAKAIVVFSDGTGNSSAAFLRTNVWRLYDAVDQADPVSGETRQVAYYDNGVGTSTFKPLAILGGVFGVGLKRNLLTLYKFVCRNYEPGDRIYAFGFSRGAFTIRLLVGLILSQGVIKCRDDELDRFAMDAYRLYRRHFNETGGLVTFFRNLRDRIIALGRRGLSKYDPKLNEKPRVRFVGVWDTVAAYGMPISELTRGIDKWVWPLSMPNYNLSDRVDTARHALALDDERDTFHPLVWDEVHEQKLIDEGAVQAGRLQQVWFTGMHSDVGGGYPDDSLAYVSLEWMAGEAHRAGLRLKSRAMNEIRLTANPCGPMHDSRRGVAGYYRYQPRKISAKLQHADPTALIMQNPDPGGRGRLTSVQIHESVIRRITESTDHYAPIVVPAQFVVVSADGSAPPPGAPGNSAARAERQEAVWNGVWKRRVNYFTAVGVTLLLVLMPWTLTSAGACTGPQCLLSPLIEAVGAILPAMAGRWIAAWSRNPGIFMLLALAILSLLWNAGRLHTRMKEQMGDLWKESLSDAPMPGGRPDDWIYRLRSSRLYQRQIQNIKWSVVPGVFGVSLLLLAVLVAVLVPALVYVRAHVSIAELWDRDCATGQSRAVESWAATAQVFQTNQRCWPTGFSLKQGERYRISFAVTDRWTDATIVTDPRGFGSERMGTGGSLLSVYRRSMVDDWFRPVLKIVPASGTNWVHGLDIRSTTAPGSVYFADFEAARDGEAVLFVNDAIVPGFDRDHFYSNNHGAAEVCIERVSKDAQSPQPGQCAAAGWPRLERK